jgi:5-hydroxytryptamine receptor 7
MSVNDSNSLTSSSDNTRKKSRINFFHGLKRDSKTSDNKKDKAAKTLGIIMGLFTVCWLPFFILALLKPIPLTSNHTIRDFVPQWLDSLLLWLGYSNSALNPIIYAQFNKEFRRPFIELLCFRCCTINQKLRDIDRKKMYADESVGHSKNHINRNNSDVVQLNGGTSTSML